MHRSDRTTSAGKLLPWGVVGFLLLAIALVYGQTLGFDWLDYDDQLFVTDCPQVRAGLGGASIVWAFTNGPLGEWYPLAILSHMLDCQLFGLDAWGHHLHSVLLHAATAVGLFFVLRSMTGQRAVPGTDRRLVAAQASGGRVAAAGPSATTSQQAVPEAAQASGGRVAAAGPSATTAQRAVPGTDRRLVAAQASGGRVAAAGPSGTTLWPSALVATIFALHPQHVESVAWIAERRDVLSGLFFVFTLGAYLGYVRHGRSAVRYLLVALLLALGLMSKAMLVTVPPLLLLLDYWPLGRFGQAADLPNAALDLPKQSFWQLVAEKLPLAAIALVDCGLTLATHARWPDWAVQPWSIRIANAIVSPAIYLFQFFYPVELAPFYPYPEEGYQAVDVVGAAAVLIAVSVAVVMTRRRCPYGLVGWCWYLGMLVPVLGLVNVAEQARADRYLYLPSIGLSVGLVWSAARLAAWASVKRVWLGAGAALVVGLLLSQAIWQTSFWHDGVALWEHALKVTADNPEAEDALAFGLRKAGRLDEAVEHYVRASRWRGDPYLINNLALAVAEQGKLAEAEALLQRTLKIDPHYPTTHLNLGYVLDLQGNAYEAVEHYLRAIELKPEWAQAEIQLASLLARQGKIDEAIEHCRRALQLAPDDEGARQLLDRLRHPQSDESPRR